MSSRTRSLFSATTLSMALVLAFGLVACGGAVLDSKDSPSRVEVERGADGAAGLAGAATAAPELTAASAQMAAPSAAPTATPAPAAAAAAMLESVRKVEAAEDGSDGATTGFFQGAPLTDEAQISIQPQNRVIVRTVDMGIIVPSVNQAADDFVAMARQRGGWVVSSDRSQKHQSFVSVRVPAESLDEFVLSVRAMADSVEHETSTSQDVTDEFVDNQAKLNGLRSTEARLLQFLEQAVNVEEALNVQVELARIQLEMETIQGRLRFLSETAAYSLVNLSLTTKPGEMPVEIGTDSATYRAGRANSFRATFRPPDGVDEFRFTWDFGDGTRPVEGSRTAPTGNPGERVTSTVPHTFSDLEQSPYIVQLTISAIGEAGLFLGSDTLIATVTEIPAIEVFAGESRVVDEGDEVEYTGSFTRPSSLRDFRYRWDFGDGSATVFVQPGEGETRAVAQHTYPNQRPDPYRVTLTIIARSEAGEVRGSGTFAVGVNEVEGFVIGGWDLGGTVRSAVRALTAVAQVLLVIVIWAGILSPVWLAAIAVIVLLPRVRRCLGWGGDRSLSLPWQRGPGEAGVTDPQPFPVPPAGGQGSEVVPGSPENPAGRDAT